MGYQWDLGKSRINEVKHGISFLQAAQIFRGPILTVQDTRYDYGELRFIALGKYDGQVLRVVFTERDGDIRIISAWKAGRDDRQTYEDKIAGSI